MFNHCHSFYTVLSIHCVDDHDKIDDVVAIPVAFYRVSTLIRGAMAQVGQRLGGSGAWDMAHQPGDASMIEMLH